MLKRDRENDSFLLLPGVQSPNDVIKKIDSHTSTQKPANNDFHNTKNT